MLSHLAKMASKLFTPSNERSLRSYYAKVVAINNLEKTLSSYPMMPFQTKH
ncbi:hypothetical protein [Candidatus Liberibacter africanus]|uniref:hypothetical protein n=1 Tax=Liberibacter africanus TaxID=34020 RepID=UPI003CC7EC83